MTSYKTTDYKSQFMLDPKITFLNHGSFGATPRPVFNSYQEWQLKLETQPVKFLGRDADDLLKNARIVLAKYLNTSYDNLVFMVNATTALNTVARSMKLKTGDEVLSTNHEYGAMDRTWKFLAEKYNFKYINQPVHLPITEKKVVIEQLIKGITSKTKAIFISHITSPTAIIFPIKEICQIARSMGILTIIDGAHAPGQIAVDLEDIGADIYAGNLHKWLCAPKGSAFLFARPEIQHLIEPLIVSWGWQSDLPSNSQFIDHHQWTGTRDISAFLAVPDAIKFQEDNNWQRIQNSCHILASEMRNRIALLTRLAPLSPDAPEWFAQMCACQLPHEINCNDIKQKLYDEYQIEVPILEWNKRKLVRVSFQAYNSINDVNRLEDALKTIL